MASDALALLVRLSVVASIAVVLVGMLRPPARRAVGAEAAYWLWLLVPASLTAALLPRAPSCLCGPESYVSPLLIRGIGAPLDLAPHVEVSHHALSLTLAWGVGALCAFGYFAYCQHVLRRSLGRLRRNADGTYSSPTAEHPMLVGAWHPKIVLPSDLDGRYSEGERAVILAHERAHVRRHDALTNAIALAIVCLIWFNPVGYWAWRRFRFDQELACDAAVLRREKVSRRRYARALAKTELATRIAVAFGWRRRHPFIERVAMLRRRTPGRAQRLLGYALALGLTLSGTYVVWAAQPAEAPGTASSGISAHHTLQAEPFFTSNPVSVSGQNIRIEKNRIAGAQLEMILAPRVPFYFQADSVSVPGDGGWLLAGHVRITAGVIRMVHAGPDVITTAVRPVFATADRAILTPQRGGQFKATLQNGRVQF